MTDDVGAFTDEPIETGLVTAAVTAPGPEIVKLTPEGKEAAKGLLGFKDVSLPKLAALARAIAQDIYPLPQLLNDNGITQNQYDFLIENNEFFKSTLAQECKDWQGIASTQKRVRLQALAALEEKLPNIASRMGSAAEKLGDVVEAAKLFAKIADVDTTSGGVGTGGQGFTISIDLGADTRITIGPPGDPPQSEGAATGGALPRVIEGTVSSSTIQQQPKG